MHVKLALICAFLFFGAVLVGGSLTGMVMSQDCCFGEDCSQENACQVTELQSPVPTETSLIGVLIILLAVGLAVGELSLERRRQEKGPEKRKMRVV